MGPGVLCRPETQGPWRADAVRGDPRETSEINKGSVARPYLCRVCRFVSSDDHTCRKGSRFTPRVEVRPGLASRLLAYGARDPTGTTPVRG